MPDFIETIKYTTYLVKMWEKSRFTNGKTLSETLTLNGIPFWDIFAVDLARIYIPQALYAEVNSSIISRTIKPELVRLKYCLRDFVKNKYNMNGCSSWPADKTILCLDFSEHMSKDVVQPLVAHLTDKKGVKVVSMMDKSRANKSVGSHHYSLHQTIWEHWDKQVDQKVSALRKELNKIKNELRASNDLMNLISDGDRSLYPQLENVFNRFLDVELSNFIPRAVLARHILEKHRPTLVISADVANPRTRVYTLLCKQMGIPCLEVQFGLTGNEGIEWQFFSADKVAVWGEDAKETMLKHGVPDEKIIITGSPRHDSLTNVSDAEVKLMRAKLGVPDASKLVLLASTYRLNSYDAYSNAELLRSMKRAVFEAADKSSGICLVVKPHPVENVRETRSIAGKNKNIIFVSQKSDIRELSRICDAFVSFGSTATLDALILGKLVICPVFPGWIWSNLFTYTGATLEPNSFHEVLEAFRLVDNDMHEGVKAKLEIARQKVLSNWVYRADCMATKRIAELALNMAEINIGTKY